MAHGGNTLWIFHGVTYKCTQSLGVGYDSDLSGLAAFVTVV